MGRRTDLTKLHDRLQETKRLAITAVLGMGGIGKTALALQYAYEQKDFYAEGRLWLTVGAGFAEEIVSFGRSPLQLGIDEGLAIAEKVRAVWQSWPGESPVLIVIDNVNKEQDYKEIQPFLPTNARFKVLMTSRIKFAGVSDLPLDVLPLSEAVQLLETLAGSEQRVWERGAAEVLCQRLGRLPLALSLVGSYLGNDRGLTLADVTQQLQAKGLETGWLNQADPSAAERGLKAAIDLSWEILESRVQDFACFLSWFAYAPIPWYLVESAIAILNEQVSSADPGKSAWINSDLLDLRQVLSRFYFLTIEDYTLPSYKIHPLLQQYLRDKATQQIDLDYRKSLVQAIMKESKKIESPLTVQQIEEIRPVIAHITEVAKEWTADLRKKEVIEPFTRLAWFYEDLVDYHQAEYWYKQALITSEKIFPSQFSNFADTFNNLAGLLQLQGKYEEAEDIYLKALAIDREILAPNDPKLAVTLNNLALLYKSRGKSSKAQRIYEEALTIARQNLPFDHPHLSIFINNLANSYKFHGKYAEAEKLYKESLKIDRKNLSQNHPQLSTHLNNLANLYKLQGKLTEAEHLYLEALMIARKSLHGDHPNLSSLLNNLAELYKYQGKYTEAEHLYIEALVIDQKTLHHNHPDLAINFNNLASLYEKQEKYSEAEYFFIEALSIVRANLPDNLVRLSSILNNLASLYEKQEKYPEAELLFVEALGIDREHLPSNHPHLANHLNNLALLYKSQGRYVESEFLLLEVLEIDRVNLVSDHSHLASTLNSLLEIYYLQQKYIEAEPLLLELLNVYEQSLGIDHPLTCTVRENYQLLLQQKEDHQT